MALEHRVARRPELGRQAALELDQPELLLPALVSGVLVKHRECQEGPVVVGQEVGERGTDVPLEGKIARLGILLALARGELALEPQHVLVGDAVVLPIALRARLPAARFGRPQPRFGVVVKVVHPRFFFFAITGREVPLHHNIMTGRRTMTTRDHASRACGTEGVPRTPA